MKSNNDSVGLAGGAPDALASPSSSRGARGSTRPAALPPRLVRTAATPQCRFSLNARTSAVCICSPLLHVHCTKSYTEAVAQAISSTVLLSLLS